MKNRSNDDSLILLRLHLQVDERQLIQPVRPETLLSDEDYGAIEAAVMETARGRWFLAEYARRNRNADTEAVLAAVRRVERLVQTTGTFEARDEVTRGMADIAQAIAAAQLMPSVPRTLPTPSESQFEAAVAEDGASDEISLEGEEEARETMDAAPLATAYTEPAPIMPSAEMLSDETLATSTAATEPDHETAEQVPGPLTGAIGQTVDTPPPVEAVASTESDVFGELETFLAEVAPLHQPGVTITAEAVPAEPKINTQAQTAESELFPIIELDEAATEALLTQDPPRQELILPTNHLVTQRWGREANHEAGETPAPVKETIREPLQTGLVTFIDEEPAEEGESVFSAPLRLEPEEPETVETAPVVSMYHAAGIPHLTISEIEAMPFAKKAALFS